MLVFWLSRKYGIEDLQSPTFTRTLQDPPSESSLGSRIKRVFRKGGESANKGIDFLAGLEDKSGMLTDSGDLVSQTISSVPVLSKSGALDVMDFGSQTAQGVKALHFPIVIAVKSGYKYYNAEDGMLESTQRQHKLVRETARARHKRTLEGMVTSQLNGKNKSKGQGKGK